MENKVALPQEPLEKTQAGVYVQRVYIVYCGRINRHNSYEIDELLDLADEFSFKALLSPSDVETLNRAEALAKRYEIPDVFAAMHNEDFFRFSHFWFAGEGCNAYARSLMDYLYYYNPKADIDNFAPKGSILWRHLNLLERNRYLKMLDAAKKKGWFFGSR